MHSLLIHQVFVGPDEVGGSRHYEFASLLANKGHEFSVITSNLDYITGKPRGRGPLSDKGGGSTSRIHVIHAWTPAILHKSFVMRVLAFLAFMLTSVLKGLRVKHVDLVMGTSPPIFQAVSAWFVAFVKRCPFLLEIRDLWPEFAIDMGVLKNPFLIKSSRFLETFLYKRAQHILVNSPAYRDYLSGKGIDESKISVVPNGVDPDGFDPSASGAEFRRELGIPEEQFVATYAGAIGMANDIPTILRAAVRLAKLDPEILVLLVGDGKERSALQAQAQRDGLRNVRFLGSVPKRRVPEVLAASNVCLATLMDIPMFRTTYPNKVFDCMAAGRPLVLGIDGVIREVVEAAEAGVFIHPGDDEALAAAICDLAENPSRSSQMGQNGRQYVCRYFDRKKQSEAFAEVLNSVVKRSW